MNVERKIKEFEIEWGRKTAAQQTVSPIGTRSFREMVFAIVTMLTDETYRKQSARIKEGLAKARAKGKRLGRPTKLRNWHSIEVRRLRAGGSSWREVARQLNFSLGTARRAERL